MHMKKLICYIRWDIDTEGHKHRRTYPWRDVYTEEHSVNTAERTHGDMGSHNRRQSTPIIGVKKIFSPKLEGE